MKNLETVAASKEVSVEETWFPSKEVRGWNSLVI